MYLWAAVAFTAYSFLIKPAYEYVYPPETSQLLPDGADAPAEDQRNFTTGIQGITRLGNKASSNTNSAAAHKLPIVPPHQVKSTRLGVSNTNWGVDTVQWHNPTHELAHQPLENPNLPKDQLDKLLDHSGEAAAMSEDFFLSKAFGETLQPSKVVPYYYRASQEPAKEDITITTLVTSNRFKVFAALVERYQGAFDYAPSQMELLCSRKKTMLMLHC